MEFLLNNPVLVEYGLELIILAVGTGWATLKAREIKREKDNEEYLKALDIVQASVEEVYRTFTRELKASREDGKLTEKEVTSAIKKARANAIAVGEKEGIDVVRIIGPYFINLAISKAAKQLK